MADTTIVQQVGAHIRTLRSSRGLSVRTLASMTGFSPSFISQVELGHASPSIDSLDRIAAALAIDLGAFFQQMPGTQPNVMHASTRQVLQSDWSLASIEPLTMAYDGQQLEATLVTFAPGGRSGSAPHIHHEEELAMVVSGKILLEMKDVQHALGPDDAVTIPADTPHRWTNTNDQDAKVLMVSARPLLRSPNDT